MLTTRREIKTKQDRNGSFDRKVFDKETTINSEKLGLDGIVSVQNTVAPKVEKKQEQKTEVKIVGSKLRVTDTYTEKAKAAKIVAGVAPRGKMTARNALMVCVYCLVVVALVAVIALNASAIGTITAKNAALSGEVGTLSTQYSALTSELSALSDVSRVTSLAQNSLNLSTAAAAGVEVVEVGLPNLLPPVNVVFSTNWFDSICDSVSGFFGG